MKTKKELFGLSPRELAEEKEKAQTYVELVMAMEIIVNSK